MLSALAARDMQRVYKLLHRIGFTQQDIAALTGQSQPEISAVIHGRKIMAYDVLARVADGLGIPRKLMGLACNCECACTPQEPDGQDDQDQDQGRRTYRHRTSAIGLMR